MFIQLTVLFLQWVYILDITHRVLGWCGVSAVDPALTAEVALRLSLVFEACTAMDNCNVPDKPRAKVPITQVSRTDSVSGQSRPKELEENHSLASSSQIKGNPLGVCDRYKFYSDFYNFGAKFIF